MKQKNFPLFTCMFILTFFVKAQDIRLTFSSQLNCDWHPLDSVVVTNTSQNYHSTTLYYPDTVLELYTNVEITEFSSNKSTELLTYPNPFSGTTQFSFSLLQAGNTTLTLYDLLGRKIIQHQQSLETGQHFFALESCPKGYYLLNINTPQSSVSSKLLCHTGTISSTPTIHYTGTQEVKNKKNLKLYDPDFPFELGNRLEIETFITVADTLLSNTHSYWVDTVKDIDVMAEIFTGEAYDTIPINVIDFFYRYASLPFLKCFFKNLSSQKVMLINTQEALDNWFSCSDTITPPVVNFDTQSVLLARGNLASSPVLSFYSTFAKKCTDQYVLKIDAWLGPNLEAGDWYLLIITNQKIPDNEIIYLEENQY